MTSQMEQLRQAAAAGQADRVLELLASGTKIEPDLEGRTALHRAAANGHLATVKALLDAGAKINARDSAGYTPIHQAATEGHEEIVKLLLKHGCHVDAQDELHGNTALHEAAWKGYSKTVEALCRHKANVYIKNNGGFTPLHLTCQNGHNQSCRIILLAACKPDVRNSYGDTALHTAARYGHAGVLRILISAFCSVNEMNKNGDTSLHIAAAMGKRKLTKILLEANCDQKIKNNQGETASDIARRKGFDEVVKIMSNPPVTVITITDTTDGKDKKSSKKQERGSASSHDSLTKHKKDKGKKSKKKHTVHFWPDEKKGYKSPYGCHMYPNLEFFPSLNLKSLPQEPLQKGEQYFADLAGNIKKGPRGMGYTCYCSPFFKHIEKKMDANRNDLLKRIDDKGEDLKEKISSLEQKTHDHLFTLNQRMKESLAFERADCCERMDRRLLRERLEWQKLQQEIALRNQMKSGIHLPYQNGHAKGVSIGSRDSCGQSLSRSKSADLLSDADSQQWTDVTSQNNKSSLASQTFRGGNFFSYAKQKLNLSSKTNGARPKYVSAPPPKSSRWKAKCYGNSILTRDSRSEGDLTICHRDETDPSNGFVRTENYQTTADRCQMTVSDRPNANRFINQNNTYPMPYIHPPEVLWNHNRSRLPKPQTHDEQIDHNSMRTGLNNRPFIDLCSAQQQPFIPESHSPRMNVNTHFPNQTALDNGNFESPKSSKRSTSFV